MTIESNRDVRGLKAVGRAVSTVLDGMLEVLEPGMSTAELDDIGSRMLETHGCRAAPRITYGFPGATCISINEEAAHGVPGPRISGKPYQSHRQGRRASREGPPF